MKKADYVKRILFLTLIHIVIFLIPARSWSLDGQVYFGLFDSENYRAFPDGGGQAEDLAGVKLGHKWKFLRPYIVIDTLIDDRHGATFHPSSVIYKVGLYADIWKGTFAKVKHMCWHPVDNNGTVEIYNLLMVGWKF
ncbi:MAG: hypothetical protein JSU83_10945 [Deltaproteobacteria bacterium]|nr:MAG: hypothetical protein JSU83_10945 [Deltaproteobacteria bacterium]